MLFPTQTDAAQINTEMIRLYRRFLWKQGDGGVIDGGINGVALGIVPLLTRLAGRAQSGYLYHYVIAMVLGIAVILTWVTLTGVTN